MNNDSRDAAATTREPLAVECLTNNRRKPLDIALEPDAKPWPASREEELLEMERHLAESDLPPTARRSEKQVARVIELLDSLEQKGQGHV